MAGPLGGGAGDPGAPSIKAKKHQRWAPWEVVPNIRERPTSMLKDVDSGLLGGGAKDTRAPTINAKKCQRWAPWEVVLEI
jgi:hypothetical protein